LFGYARWAAYLFYSADQKSQAVNLLLQAYEMRTATNGDEISWDNWTLSRARTLAGIRGNTEAGVEFIKWVSDAISLSPSERNSLLARYCADQAYLANQNGQRRQVIINFLRAIQYDPNWLVNKGLWSVALRAGLRID
jgi:hypothetical protein